MTISPHVHIRSLPPKGALVFLEAARRNPKIGPHVHMRSLPPEGALVFLEAALRNPKL